jgi:RNA polymerase sigma-70 factor (ECF subfamily)
MERAEKPVTITIGKVKPKSLSANDGPDFEAIFQQHWPRLVAVLFRMTGDRHDAEDLALEVFWRLHLNPSVMERSPDPGGWLYRVATRLGYNALRSRRRRGHYEQQAGRQALETATPPVPEAQFEQRQERERVRDVLAHMRPRSAQAIILRHSGLSYTEVAAALGVPPGSVGTLLARAEKEFERLYRGFTAARSERR